MSKGKELVEALKQKIVDLSKKIDEGKANGGMNKEAVEKLTKELVDAQFEARKESMRSELRKGVFAKNPEDVKPHDLIVNKSDDPQVQGFQRWQDDVYILSKVLDVHPTQLKHYQKYAPTYSELKKALDTAEASGGTEWLPTNFSADLIDRVDVLANVASLFRKIQMPTDQFKLPARRAHGTAYKVSEQTADGAMTGTSAFTASQFTTANVTLDAVKMGVATEWSVELEEDSIIPVIEMVKDDIAISLAFGLEDAIINGDTAATHQDSDVTNASDVRKLWGGLRKSAATQSLATFNLANLRAMRRKLGRYGAALSKLVWLVSPKGWVKMQEIDEVITMEKYGNAATVVTGEIAKLDGIPIVMSEKVRDDLNASGVNDATTNEKGIIILFRSDTWVLGERRKVTTRSFEDIRRDQTVMVNTWRGDFRDLYSGQGDHRVVGINLSV